jgi:hypothetical protein
MATKDATAPRSGEVQESGGEAKVREVNVGSRTVRMTQETVPTGLVPLPRFLRRFAGLD